MLILRLKSSPGDKLGHVTKACPEERATIERPTLSCALCGEEGHRVRVSVFPSHFIFRLLTVLCRTAPRSDKNLVSLVRARFVSPLSTLPRYEKPPARQIPWLTILRTAQIVRSVHVE